VLFRIAIILFLVVGSGFPIPPVSCSFWIVIVLPPFVGKFENHTAAESRLLKLFPAVLSVAKKLTPWIRVLGTAKLQGIWGAEKCRMPVGKDAGWGARRSTRHQSMRARTVLHHRRELFRQPAANRIDNASHPCVGMKPNAQIGTASKKQVASPVCLCQESRGFGLRDNKRCNPGSDDANEDDQVPEKFSATASDPAFRNSILPRACRAYAHGFHAAGGKQLGYLVAKLAVAIKNCIAVRTRFRKCFSQLLHYPGAGRMFRDVEMEDPASTVIDDEKSIQDSKGEGWHGEEVHGRDDLAVIAKESSPALTGIVGRRQTTEIPQDGAFGDVEAEFQKLTVNSRSTPAGIFVRHLPDESSNLGIDLWPAKAHWPRPKAPKQPKASAMPGDNGFWFNDDQDVAPSMPKPAEQNPKYPILDSEPRARMFSLEYG
jgi:hypothetical protein